LPSFTQIGPSDHSNPSPRISNGEMISISDESEGSLEIIFPILGFCAEEKYVVIIKVRLRVIFFIVVEYNHPNIT
jgi:hypothetical protein